MQKVVFDKGEERHVKILIHAAGNAPFTIREANYELLLHGDIENSGTCEIDKHTIDVFISPMTLATYRLQVIYKIADETLVEQIEVVVR